jgi:hypothetical protein
MKKTENQIGRPCVNERLKNLAGLGSFCGLFLSLFGTGIIWAGTDSFNCSGIIWKISAIINLSVFSLTWFTYALFKNTGRLLGYGLLSIFMLFSFFWLFGAAMFYFYFLFAPINTWLRAMTLAGATAMLLYRAYLIARETKDTFQKHSDLFNQMYSNEGASIKYNREAFSSLQKACKDRNSFKSFHLYAAMAVTPFVLVLNRVLTPVVGNGHGVFMILAFFSLPILLWGTQLFVQIFITTIYYPIKLHQETGKPVLMQNW